MHNEVVQQRSSARAAVKHHNQECLKLYSGLLEIEVEVKKIVLKGATVYDIYQKRKAAAGI